jgi:hypothetical protein
VTFTDEQRLPFLMMPIAGSRQCDSIIAALFMNEAEQIWRSTWQKICDVQRKAIGK